PGTSNQAGKLPSCGAPNTVIPSRMEPRNAAKACRGTCFSGGRHLRPTPHLKPIMARPHSLIALLGFGAGVTAAAWFGSRYSPRNSRNQIWYSRLEKPAFNPPDSVFPIVWTALYALIAFSGWRTWQAEDSRHRSQALRLWVKQLMTNAQWSRLFF